MFGGFGIFRDGVMFGLIAQGTLYFKADDINRTAHEGAGMPPFRYTRGDKVREMSYWQVPLDVLEDPVELATWTYHAIAAAGRGQSEKSKT